MKIYSIIVLAALLLPGQAMGQQSMENNEATPNRVNYRDLVSRADLVYNEPVTRSEAGMPIGNGRMGSLVWTSPSAIRFQINRNDVFGNNSASNNFYQRNTDYCGGTGFLDIDFGEALFTGGDFRQALSCYDGLVTVAAKDVKASVLAWDKEDVMAIEIQDTRPKAGFINIDLRMLRDAISRKGDHEAISKISVVNDNIVLTQQFKENDYYCGSAVVVGISGSGARAEIANESTVRLMTTPGQGGFTVYIASVASFDPQVDLVDVATKKLNAAKTAGFEELLASNKAWWHRFWQKGFIQLHSADKVADDVGRYYTYYLYVMAASSQGKYPTKFNGMLWSTGGDTRQWGALYWGANQSCLYNALFASNRLDLLDPMFDMYTDMYRRCALAATQQWGSKGIYIPETVGFDGPAPVPDSLTQEMQALYLVQKPWEDRSTAFRYFAYTKLPYLSRWNWKKDGGWKNGRWTVLTKSNSVFGHTSHILSRSAKIAYKYWLYYQYTQDTAWLRKYAYPMLRGVAEFYRNFPNVRKGEDGNYHIYNVNDNEALWGGHNTVEEISSMMGIFPVVLEASEILHTDGAMRPIWRDFISHLSPLPAHTGNSGETVWMKSELPVVQGNPEGLPDRNTMPVWYFDLCNRGSDKAMTQIANQTYDAYFQNGINKDTRVGVLSRLPVSGVRLGRVDATRYLIPNQIHSLETDALANRMDQREGRQTTNVERLGRAAEALQEALLQSVPAGPGADPVLYVFPAWPREWDAQFELLSRGNFLVTASMQKGVISFVQIKAQAGGVCRVSNPWPNSKVTLYRNGKKWRKMDGRLISFNTAKGEVFKMVSK